MSAMENSSLRHLPREPCRAPPCSEPPQESAAARCLAQMSALLGTAQGSVSLPLAHVSRGHSPSRVTAARMVSVRIAIISSSVRPLLGQ